MVALWALAYVASTAFHVHENKLTERADYFMPVISFMIQIVWSAVILSSGVRRQAAVLLPVMLLPMAAFALFFMYTMHFVRFDYGWHMRVVVGLVIAQFFVVAPWFGSTRKPYAKLWLLGQLSMALAVPFELYDFVPFLGVMLLVFYLFYFYEVAFTHRCFYFFVTFCYGFFFCSCFCWLFYRVSMVIHCGMHPVVW
jgi:hypothetical protein